MPLHCLAAAVMPITNRPLSNNYTLVLLPIATPIGPVIARIMGPGEDIEEV